MKFLKSLFPETLKGQELSALLMLLVAGFIAYQGESPNLNVVISLFAIILFTAIFLFSIIAVRFLDREIARVEK